MKKSITLAALLLVVGTSVFAASPAKFSTPAAKEEITFVPLKSDKGFGVQVNTATAGKTIVIVYDDEKNVIFKDLLSKNAIGEKGYIVNNLPVGDYTIEVVSGGQSVKKEMHVYDDGQAKSYFFFQ
jgi:hypothetical protein